MNNNKSQTIRVGLFFFFGLLLLWIVYEALSQNGLSRQQGYGISARFKDIRQLQEGDEVRLAGVHIGEVVGTALKGNRAVVAMVIDKQFKIPRDSIATIATSGLLGNNYISIAVGKEQEFIAADGVIKTKAIPDLNDVMFEFGSIGKEIRAMISENRENVKKTVTNIEKMTHTVADGKGTLGKIINDDTAYDQLLAAGKQVEEAAKHVGQLSMEAQEVVADVKSGKGTVGLLLYDEQTRERVQQTVANIKDFSAKLNDKNNSIGRLLADDSLYNQAQGVLGKVDSAVDSMDDSGPITAMGVLANGLF